MLCVKELVSIWNSCKGYKTYVVALAAVIYGIHVGDANIIIFGLGLAGIRNGMSSEISKILIAKDPVAAAKQEAPAIVGEAIVEAEATK